MPTTRSGSLKEKSRSRRMLRIVCKNCEIIIVGAGNSTANQIEGGAVIGAASFEIKNIQQVDWVEGNINLLSIEKIFPS